MILRSTICAFMMALPILAQSGVDKDSAKADPRDAKIAALQAQLNAAQAATDFAQATAELWQARANAQASACLDVGVARALIKAVDAQSSAQAAMKKLQPATEETKR